jgi:hypothetical protein
VPSELRQRIAEIRPRAEKARLQRQHHFERGACLFRTVELQQDDTAVVDHFGSVRRKRQRFVHARQRLVAAAERRQRATKIAHHWNGIGIELERLGQQRLRR